MQGLDPAGLLHGSACSPMLCKICIIMLQYQAGLDDTTSDACHGIQTLCDHCLQDQIYCATADQDQEQHC